MSRAAAVAVVELLERQPDALMVLATGASPLRAYELLAERGRREPERFSRLRILKLDEWGGLAMDDPASCEVHLRRTLLEPLGIGPDRYFGWVSRPADVELECLRLREWLSEHGPADLCILGLGLNGHLGFNEPAESLQLWPHRAELAPESRRHGMLREAVGTPEYGLTLGMGDLLNANQIYLLVSGPAKQGPLARLLTPEITPRFPASMLWLHRNVTVFCDAAALPGGTGAWESKRGESLVSPGEPETKSGRQEGGS